MQTIIIRAASIKLEISQYGSKFVILDGKSFMLEDRIVSVVKQIVENPDPFEEKCKIDGLYVLKFKGDSQKCSYFNVLYRHDYEMVDSILR